MRTFAISTLCALVLATSASAQNLLSNSTFDDEILTGGQTELNPGDWYKLTIPSDPGQISGVTDWNYQLTLTNPDREDVGLSRRADIGTVNDGVNQFFAANRWDIKVSQTVGSIVDGDAYTATIDIAFADDNPTTLEQKRAGRFALYAGAPNPSDYQDFGGAILLGEVIAGTQARFDAGDAQDVTVPDRTWQTLQIDYTGTAAHAGMPLTVVFNEVSFSAGPSFWDNATLTPEPSALFGLLLGLGLIRRR